MLNQGQRRVSRPLSPKQVVEYYERKTESILERYGPGPRVHFHTGFLDKAVAAVTRAQAYAALHESQERMLRHVAEVLNLRRSVFQRVLDVGCGLGGTAIFWAEEFGFDITAVTNAPSHVSLVERFSVQAGVKSQVHPVLCDALETPGEDRFDIILAIESSCHLTRRPWFRRATELLRRGGRLFISDCFIEQERYREPFDRYWCARIGTIEEYLAAGREAGLTLQAIEEVSPRVANFWSTTMALVQLEASEPSARPDKASKARESFRIHSLMRNGLLDGGLTHALLSFAKE
jgi:tocopherol O-methyltransferase